MESFLKTAEAPLQILNDLLGESKVETVRTIDLSFDNQSAACETGEQLNKLYLGIEDTQTEWASLRSSLKPATGEWIQPKEELLVNLINQESQTISKEPNSIPLELEPMDEDRKAIMNMLSEATVFLKEELNVIKSELSNIHLYKGAIKNLSVKIGEHGGDFGSLCEHVKDSAWVIGQKLDDIDGKFERFKEDLPLVNNSLNEPIISALREFEQQCLRLGAEQLDSISRIRGLENGSQVEELQENLSCLISGQKKIFDSISDVLSSLKTVSLSVSKLPGIDTLELIANKQGDQIDSIKLEIVESRVEDRREDRLLRKSIAGLGLVCLLIFGAIVYQIY